MSKNSTDDVKVQTFMNEKVTEESFEIRIIRFIIKS